MGFYNIMSQEYRAVKELFSKLLEQPKTSFPQPRNILDAPKAQGVYIIRKNHSVLHVGRTYRGKDGIKQRLKNHLQASSSFANDYLNGNGAILREKGYTYQHFVVNDPRKRALLEAYAIGMLCPKHVGIGE